MYGRALRSGLRAVGGALSSRALIVPVAYCVAGGASYGSAAAAAIGSSEGSAAGGGAISSASYPANDPLEDRWVVARVRLPASQRHGGQPPSTGGMFALRGSSSALSPAGARAAAAPQSLLLAAVMDGHGGWQASDFVQARLAAVVESELQHNSDNESPEQLAAALSRAFERLDREFIGRVRPAFEIGFGEVARVGCCAIAVLVSPTHIVVANAGDCRAVYARASLAPASPQQAGGRPGGASAAASPPDDAGAAFRAGGAQGGPAQQQQQQQHQAELSAAQRIEAEEEQRMEDDLRRLSASVRMRRQQDAGDERGARMAGHAAGEAPAPQPHSDGPGLSDLVASFIQRWLGPLAPARARSSEPARAPVSRFHADAEVSAAALSAAPGALLSARGSPTLSFSSSGAFEKQLFAAPQQALLVDAVPLSDDHNARMPREQLALSMMHPGEEDVVYQKPGTAAWYVKARLQPTRAIGDAYLKHSEFNGPPGQRLRGRHIPPPYTPPYITARPETRILALSSAGTPNGAASGSSVLVAPSGGSGPSDSFLILACDGVWDVMSSADAARFVAEDAGDPASVADRLVHHVLALEAHANALDVSTLMATPPGRRRRALHDDLTAVIIRLGPDGPLLSRGGVASGRSSSTPSASAGLWAQVKGMFQVGSPPQPRNDGRAGG